MASSIKVRNHKTGKDEVREYGGDVLDESEGRMGRFWEKLFKNSLRIGAYRIEEINDTWAVMKDGELPNDVTYDTQQGAVDYAVAQVRG